jgi:hypothetical protein
MQEGGHWDQMGIPRFHFSSKPLSLTPPPHVDRLKRAAPVPFLRGTRPHAHGINPWILASSYRYVPGTQAAPQHCYNALVTDAPSASSPADTAARGREHARHVRPARQFIIRDMRATASRRSGVQPTPRVSYPCRLPTHGAPRAMLHLAGSVTTDARINREHRDDDGDNELCVPPVSGRPRDSREGFSRAAPGSTSGRRPLAPQKTISIRSSSAFAWPDAREATVREGEAATSSDPSAPVIPHRVPGPRCWLTRRSVKTSRGREGFSRCRPASST